MNIENKTVLVTGSTDGVGRLVARRLADQGARVLIHGRDRIRGEQLLNQIRAARRGSAAFLPADFASLAEVRRLPDVVRQECDRLDILVNNAGIGSGGSAGSRQTSQDGHELRFAVNYLSGFLLTRLLLPLVMLGKPGRIVNVSSLGQHPIDFDDVMLSSRLQRLTRLCSKQARPDHVHVRSRMRTRSRDSHSELPASRYLHGDDDGAGRAVSRLSAPSRRERKRSSISPSRTPSTDVPGSSTTDCGRRRRTSRPMTIRRAIDSGCLACN